ncbi:MAG: hypothetical protein IJ716_06020 [Lachnospiraceae bacterium]|nr:hypothetical protein [Lachnospiraceae bacterium]
MIDRELIIQRLREDDPEDNADFLNWIADQIFENWIDELQPNIQEWIDHEPLSDIYIGKLSINLLTEAWNGLNMCEAIKCMKRYKDRGCVGEFGAIHHFDIM